MTEIDISVKTKLADIDMLKTNKSDLFFQLEVL